MVKHFTKQTIKQILFALFVIYMFKTCSTAPEPIEIVKEKVVTKVDTVVVIPEPEREVVYISKVDTVFIEVQDTTVLYVQSSHSDRDITAVTKMWVDLIDYSLKDSEFEYVLKRRIERNTHTLERIERIVVVEKKPPLLSFNVGAFTDTEDLYPTIGIRARQGSSFYYGYGITNNQHLIGITIPINK